MKGASLFSGVLGLDMAVEAAYGCQTVVYAERDPYCQAVIRARRPGATIFDDVSDVDARGCEVLYGGFPCQDISSAGARRGMHGVRSGGGWASYLSTIETFGPRLVVVENVGRLRSHGLGLVLCELASLGFDAEWSTLRALDVGAPHLRRRVFVIAARGPVPNAVRKRIRQLRQRDREQHPFAWQALARATGPQLADGDGDGREGLGPSHDDHWRHALGDDAARCGPFPPGPDDGPGWKRWRRAGGPEPGLRGGDDGFSTRLDTRRRRARLRCLGNAVCRQQALEAIVELTGRLSDEPVLTGSGRE